MLKFRHLLEIRHVVCGLAAVTLAIWIVAPQLVQPHASALWERAELQLPTALTEKPVATPQEKPVSTPQPSPADAMTLWSERGKKDTRPVAPKVLDPLITGDPVSPPSSAPSANAQRPAIEIQKGPLTGARTSTGMNPLHAVQHTPTGQIALGKEFFHRMRRVAMSLHKVNSDVRKAAQERHLYLLDLTIETALPDPEWRSLASWWKLVGSRQQDAFETDFRGLSMRWERLIQQPPSAERDEQIRSVVRTCGQRYLKVPFHNQSQRFDLDAPLPEDAPEVGLEKGKQMYRILKGEEWGTDNSRKIDDLVDDPLSGAAQSFQQNAAIAGRVEALLSPTRTVLCRWDADRVRRNCSLRSPAGLVARAS